MNTPRARRADRLVSESWQIATAAPIVMALRLTRMGLAGNEPTARDRREWHLMGAEKIAAFHEAWIAMSMQAWQANQQFAMAWAKSLMTPWWLARPTASLTRQWSDAATNVLAHGAAPVRRRAVANARRLSRSRLK